MKAAAPTRSRPPTGAEHVHGGGGTGLGLIHAEWGIGSGVFPWSSSFTTFPLSPVHQLNEVRGLCTHLVTLLSTFTRGTGRARKSLEARVTQISKEGVWCLSLQEGTAQGRPKGESD